MDIDELNEQRFELIDQQFEHYKERIEVLEGKFAEDDQKEIHKEHKSTNAWLLWLSVFMCVCFVIEVVPIIRAWIH